jgi:TolB-like protein/Flp pilus assembly protein TadD
MRDARSWGRHAGKCSSPLVASASRAERDDVGAIILAPSLSDAGLHAQPGFPETAASPAGGAWGQGHGRSGLAELGAAALARRTWLVVRRVAQSPMRPSSEGRFRRYAGAGPRRRGRCRLVSETPLAESLLASLRKRKLVQWSAGYAAAAWVLLQVVTLVGQQFDWSPVLLRAITIVLGVGFFVAVVLAWFHGERGQQRVTALEAALLALCLAIGAAMIWRVAQAPAEPVRMATADAGAAAAIPEIARDPSIAVLPFANMSGERDNEYFSDGVSEELLNLLSKVRKLRVIARTSSFAFKGQNLEIPDIARRLHVASVLEGSVRKSGDKVRITAQLVRASDGSHLWSQTYDRTLDDIFKVQDEIAAKVVAELKVKLLGAAPTSRQTDPQAYALFLQAVQLFRQATAESLEKSVALSRQALAIDPRYAPAWHSLAIGIAEQANFGLLPPDEGYAHAREAAEKALAIDPGFAPAHSLLGYFAADHDNDPAAAAAHFQRALALDPSSPSVRMTSANFLSSLGRLDQARALLEANLRRDPVSLNQIFSLGIAQYWAEDYEAAIGSFRRVLDLSPGRFAAHNLIGTILLLQGDAAGGIAEIRRETNEAARMAGLALAWHALGRKAEADAALDALIRAHEKDQTTAIAAACAFRGETDEAFAWLDKAVRYGSGISDVAYVPLFKGLHADPRWLAFLRRIGRAPEQLAKIDFAVNVHEDDAQAGARDVAGDAAARAKP